MGVFRQLGDPLAAAECLCQHHGAAYNEMPGTTTSVPHFIYYDRFAAGATIVSTPITITERCCIAVNAAMIVPSTYAYTDFEIERPLGTIRTTQEDSVTTQEIKLMHHATWEVLDPGTYTYYLVNRSAGTRHVIAAWLKIIASDCEG